MRTCAFSFQRRTCALRRALVCMPGVTLSKPLLAAAAIVALLDASAAALPPRHDVGQLTLQELVESATSAPAPAPAPASALSDAEISRIATFGAVLGQYDACHDSAVVQALNDTLNKWSQAERETWLAIGRRDGDAAGWPPERLAHCPSAAGTKRDACLGPPNKGWRIGVPCADTARWWVSDARWDARPMWGHCCNKAPGLARCPVPAIATPSRCASKLEALNHHCDDDGTLLCPTYVHGDGRNACFVYSFGIDRQWSFEDWAGSDGCEVHAFDPTTRTRGSHEAHRASNVHFHFMGLGARANGTAALQDNHYQYGPLGGEVLALDDLMAKLGHGRRQLSMLKVDCEGCEWEAFDDVARRDPMLLREVCTIVMEVHVSSTLQMGTEAQLKLMASFWQRYIEEAGFRFFLVHRNYGNSAAWGKMHPVLTGLGFNPKVPAYEIGLHRPGCLDVSR